MLQEKEHFVHPELGEIRITYNRRTRRIIMRVRPDAIYITQPPTASREAVLNFIQKYSKQITEQQKANVARPIDFNYTIDAPLFKFKLQPTNCNHFQLKREEGHCYTLLCPSESNFNDKRLQEWLKKIITNTLKECAKEQLPTRLKNIAADKGFKFGDVTTRDCHSRWGSCSSRGNVSLSIYLMLLPEALIDYVLLHELCHTIEMNHGPKFWQLLDSATNGAAKKLRTELRKHKTAIV